MTMAMVGGFHECDIPNWKDAVNADAYVHITDAWVEEQLRNGTHVMSDIDSGAIQALEEVKTPETIIEQHLNSICDRFTYTDCDKTFLCVRIHPDVCGINPFGCLPETKYKTFVLPE